VVVCIGRNNGCPSTMAGAHEEDPEIRAPFLDCSNHSAGNRGDLPGLLGSDRIPDVEMMKVLLCLIPVLIKIEIVLVLHESKRRS
jgi:hypothetical protein